MAQRMTLQAKALYQALSAAIGEDGEKRGELDAAFDILDPLIDSLEGEGA
jgi:hypothetical protein